MLVLTRKLGECIHIGDDVRVTVVAVQGQKIRLGIDAPKSVNIVRSELVWRDEIFPEETTTHSANP
jgi:carbon storage regulator